MRNRHAQKIIAITVLVGIVLFVHVVSNSPAGVAVSARQLIRAVGSVIAGLLVKQEQAEDEAVMQQQAEQFEAIRLAREREQAAEAESKPFEENPKEDTSVQKASDVPKLDVPE